MRRSTMLCVALFLLFPIVFLCVRVCVYVRRGQSHLCVEVSAPVWRQQCMHFKAATSCYLSNDTQ